jgi:hypothetical protein
VTCYRLVKSFPESQHFWGREPINSARRTACQSPLSASATRTAQPDSTHTNCGGAFSSAGCDLRYRRASGCGKVSAMSHTKEASKRKRKRRALPVLGAAGLSFSLASGASAEPIVNLATPNTGASHEITLADEEISDVSLATFYVFDKENAGTFRPNVQLVRGGGCGGGGGGCRACGGGGGCRGCGGGGA